MGRIIGMALLFGGFPVIMAGVNGGSIWLIVGGAFLMGFGRGIAFPRRRDA